MAKKKNEQPLVPELRFPEFEGEWEEKLLERFLVESRDRGSTGDLAKKLTVKLWGNGVYEKEEATKGSSSTQYYVRRSGQFIYSKLDFLNQAFGIIPEHLDRHESTVDLPCFDIGEDLVPEFLLEYVQRKQFYKKLGEIADGGRKAKRIQVDIFLSFPISLPINRDEQQKIADCLGSLDELIGAHRAKRDALEDHKKGLLQQLFPAPGETTPTLRFPGFEGEWKEKRLPEVSENLNNQRVPITANQRTKGSVPYYGATGVIDYVEGYIFDEPLLCISEDGANLVARTYPIAFSIQGKTWVNNHTHVLRFPEQVTQIIVEAFLNGTNLEDFLTGMAQPKLNRQKLDSIPIPLSTLPEQEKIANCLGALDALITAQTEQIAALKKHKEGLMQQLFPNPDLSKA